MEAHGGCRQSTSLCTPAFKGHACCWPAGRCCPAPTPPKVRNGKQSPQLLACVPFGSPSEWQGRRRGVQEGRLRSPTENTHRLWLVRPLISLGELWLDGILASVLRPVSSCLKFVYIVHFFLEVQSLYLYLKR